MLALYLLNPVVLSHVSWLRVALLPVAVLVIPLSVAADLLISPSIVIARGEIRIDAVRLPDELEAARIEPDPGGRGLVLRVEYTTPRGRRRTRRVGLKASIAPRAVKAVFERGTTRTLDVVDTPHIH